MPQKCAALLVMSQERRSGLMSCLETLDLHILTASNCSEVGDCLNRYPGVGVVLTELSLPDGSWFDVLQQVSNTNPDVEVVVCARVGDERLWTQVLETGAFDMLVEPYENCEVARILNAAFRPGPLRRLAAAG